MGDSLLVEEFQGRGDVTNHGGGFSFGEKLPLLNMIEELTSRHLLEDKIELVRFFEVFCEVYDILVTLAWQWWKVSISLKTLDLEWPGTCSMILTAYSLPV